MAKQQVSEAQRELDLLCISVKELVEKEEYGRCQELIAKAMEKYPDAPQPHNLLGLVLEKQHDHLKAMKHFRAAWALDPTYLPARQNLTCYGTFFTHGSGAYTEADCPRGKTSRNDDFIMEYDAHGVGRLVRRTKR